MTASPSPQVILQLDDAETVSLHAATLAQQLTVERTAKREPDAATHGAAAAASAPGDTGAGGGETEEWSLEGWLESLRLQDVVAAALRTSEV